MLNRSTIDLGHDEDRQKSNYLDKNENGHVTNKKSRISLSESTDENQEKFGWAGPPTKFKSLLSPRQAKTPT